jgi:hypothetical protein
VAQTCNPSDPGGRDQEDLLEASLNKQMNIHHKKRTGGVAQVVGPDFEPQYHKKKKKEETRSAK